MITRFRISGFRISCIMAPPAINMNMFSLYCTRARHLKTILCSATVEKSKSMLFSRE